MLNSESDSLWWPRDIFAFGVTAAFICNTQGTFQWLAKSQEKNREPLRWEGRQQEWQIRASALKSR